MDAKFKLTFCGLQRKELSLLSPTWSYCYDFMNSECKIILCYWPTFFIISLFFWKGFDWKQHQWNKQLYAWRTSIPCDGNVSVTVQNLSKLQRQEFYYYYHLTSFRSKSKREETSLVFALHPTAIEIIVLPSFLRASKKKTIFNVGL